MTNKLVYETLHCHTLNSDGILTHEQVLDECLKNEISVVAFTDHDSLVEPEQFEKLKKLIHQVKFISGIEVSCDCVSEVEGKLPLFHVTGLFVDPTNQKLVEFTNNQLKDRVLRMRKVLQNLKSLGFKIDEEDVYKFVQGKAVGSPHVVSALSTYPKNWELLNKFYEELKSVATTDPLRKKQLEEINNREEKQKWYVLVMSQDSLHSVYVSYGQEPVMMDQAVQLIRQAGGIALIAHWSYLRDRLTIDIIERFLANKRLDGMETVYSFGIEKDRELFVSDMLKLSELCAKYGLVQGGGGDFHKPEDFSLMTDPNFADFAQRTKGMVERILKIHPDLDLTWTSLI